MRPSFELRATAGVVRAIAVECVFLIPLIGFMAVVHFHAGQSAPNHLCSACALAHAGVLSVDPGPQVPIFVPSVISEALVDTLRSLLRDSSHLIRPPPAA